MNNKHSQKLLRQQAIDWLMTRQSETCTEADRQAFARWLAEDDNHRLVYQQVEKHWQWMAQFKNADFPARQQALSYRRKSPITTWSYRFASILLLVAGLTAFSANGWLGSFESYATAKGERQTVTLADGSTLELNTDSEVRVHLNHWQRSVELVRGEVFFQVAHDEQKPFEVRADNGRIRDIGTAFNVYRQAEQVLVGVQEGIVEVEALDKRQLLAGQQLAFNHDGVFQAADELNIAELTAWRQGKMVFHNQSLQAVLAELSRYHNTPIRLHSARLNDLRVSGTFHTAKPDDALNAISSLLPVTVHHTANHEIVLKPSTH
ncbi:MAG: FecR family protein [Methylococcales bacterium]|nr:FecR family protein [Methylococcales bacterium]MDP3839215.1 FecR family protein [Methylococcales bacterium]